MTQEGSTGTVQQNSSQNQQGHDTPSEDQVTPELKAKFDEVFGSTKGDDEGGDKGQRGKRKPQQLSSDARNKATLAKQRKTQQRNQFFGGSASDEGDEGDEGGAKGDSEESAQNRSQPLKRGTAQQKPAANAQSSSAQQQSKPSDEEGNEVDQNQAADQPNPGEGDGDDDEPTLNPVLRHAARRAGWTAEEADEFFAQNPEKAEQYFQKMHESFNSVSAQFASLGTNQGQQPPQGQQFPAQQQQRQQPPQQQQQKPNADPVDDLIAAMYGTTADKLATDYNPEFVEEFARKPARYLQEHVIAPLRQMQAHYQAQQATLVAKEAQTFTKGLEADFKDLYGTGKGRSKDQQAALNDVYQQADFIYAGAQRKGVSMTVSEALERAHAIVASKFLEESTRKRVLASVKKRSSQLTQRPTQRKPGTLDANGKPKKSIEAATEALTKRMAELGIE